MSKLKYDKSKSSQALQQEFNDTCFKLGQEVRNEDRASENQVELRAHLVELEEGFRAALQREQEAKAAKERADANTKAFEAKAAPTEEAPATT